MFVKEIMTREVITVLPDDSLKKLGEIFKEKRISGIPVADKHRNILGIVTLNDMLRVLNQIYIWREMGKKVPEIRLSEMFTEEKLKAKVRDVMTKDVIAMGEDATLDDLMALMFTKKIHTIPVIKDAKLVGVVGKRDLIYACF